jgi:hypothetical protein
VCLPFIEGGATGSQGWLRPRGGGGVGAAGFRAVPVLVDSGLDGTVVVHQLRV